MNMIWTLDASKLKILATHALPVSEYMESWDRPASVKGSILMRQLENQIAVLLHRMMARLFWYFQTRALKWTECRSIDINCRHVTQTWWQEHWTNAKQEQDTKCRQSNFGDIYTHRQCMRKKLFGWGGANGWFYQAGTQCGNKQPMKNVLCWWMNAMMSLTKWVWLKRHWTDDTTVYDIGSWISLGRWQWQLVTNEGDARLTS